jgi:hypothetical protein
MFPTHFALRRWLHAEIYFFPTTGRCVCASRYIMCCLINICGNGAISPLAVRSLRRKRPPCILAYVLAATTNSIAWTIEKRPRLLLASSCRRHVCRPAGVCREKRKTTSLSKEANINSDFTHGSQQTGIQLAHGFTTRDRPLPLSSRCTRTIRPSGPAPQLGSPGTTAAAHHACQFTMCRAWTEGRSVLVPSGVPATRRIAHSSPTRRRPISREGARVQKSRFWTLVLVPRLSLARSFTARYFLVRILTVSAPSGRRHRVASASPRVGPGALGIGQCNARTG